MLDVDDGLDDDVVVADATGTLADLRVEEVVTGMLTMIEKANANKRGRTQLH